MMAEINRLVSDWDYVSIGYPGPVLDGRPIAEPRNLGRGLPQAFVVKHRVTEPAR